MALSQIQCLDDNNVNPRIYESKPEFFYCEEQRLALEALLRDGREAFAKYLESRGLRGFLSDLEQETLAAALEPFDPDAELFSGEREGEPEPLSLQYWPDVSDTSIPQMDLGWPDSESYRGVTRTTVYTQPPMEGQPHIKEVARKMIAQAQKVGVIAVVMDVFTDVDIFRDLLDAGFKRKVSVYILLERTMLPHFLSMCRRANMHPGHLKHLRVRCTEGSEFYTRYCTRIKGQLGHRFMFIDGDKAVSGSYSFTWMSSRLDRNLITVTTGQAVDAFDQVFRYLYVTSSFVDLRQVTTDPEPEPDTRHQPLNPSPKSQPRQQPGSRGSSPSRPLSSTRGSQAQAPRPSGIRDLSQPESRALQSNVKEFVYKPPPRRSQSRSPSPMKAAPTGSAAGRKQVSQSQLLTWQPPAAQTRSKFDPPQIKAAKQQASTLHTLSSLQPQAHPLASSQEVSEQAAQETEEARVPFNLSLSRLYNFKGLRDKWTKLPTQSRRSRTGTPKLMARSPSTLQHMQTRTETQNTEMTRGFLWNISAASFSASSGDR
ncbi:protein FAM83G-like [Xiphophorus hellerii]|uniref:protein FAM83G-like n=1 Tax=Xiphophorus hellerii TaxID=8084 RepID=UPI0013B37EBF|nr:protein FAM83G-like [Xiphophorus hellerii]